MSIIKSSLNTPSILKRVSRIIQTSPSVIIWIALFLLLILSGLLSGSFLNWSHLMNVARQASGLGIVTVTQSIVLIVGGLDFSNSGVITLVDVIAATILNGKDDKIIAVIVLSLCIGIFVGFVNGVLITKLKIPSFIGTLGMFGILKGIAYVYTGGAPKGAISPFLQFLGTNSVITIPIAVIAWLIFFAFLFVLMRKTPFGRYVHAIGGNTQAAHLGGVSVNRVVIMTYILSGLSAAIAGLILGGYIGAGSLAIGQDYNLNSIAASIIGGTPFGGGSGSIIGSVGGSIFHALTFSLLRFLGLAYRNQLIVEGVILILAVYAYTKAKL